MEWFAKAPLASALRAFVAVVLAMLAADWAESGAISFDRWQTWVIAGVAACVPMIARWLNPADPLGSIQQNAE
jgi:hypothetical protein